MLVAMAGTTVCSCLLFICLYQCIGVDGNTTSSNEDQLLTSLFKSYDKRVRPVENSTLSVEIAFGVQLSKVIKVDSKSQQLSVSVVVTQMWKNPYLKWNKTLVGSIDSITVDPNEIWVPDVGLLNNADQNVAIAGGRKKFQTNVIVNNEGICIWRSPAIFTSDCDIAIRNWPFDTQRCQLTFSSFTMTRKALKLNLLKQVTKADRFETNGDWAVEEINVLKKEDLQSSCCADGFSVVGFEVVLERKSFYYVLNLIIPSAILCLLSLSSFLIPSESGERIGFVTTILLAMAVYLLLIAEVLPETSKLSITGLLFVLSIVENAAILLATIVVLRCFHGTGEPPVWLQRLYCCCCPCLGKKPPPKNTNQNILDKYNIHENGDVAMSDMDAPHHIPAVFDQNESKEFDQPTWKDISLFVNYVFFILSILVVATTYAVMLLIATL